MKRLRRVLVDGEPREHLGLVPGDRLPLAERDERQHVVGLPDPRPVVHKAEVREHRRGRDHEPVGADDPLLLRGPELAHPLDHLGGVPDVAEPFAEVARRQLVGRPAAAGGPVGRPVLALLGLGFAEQADLDDARVGVRRVVHVAGEVLGADLPVGLDPPALGTAQLDAVRALPGVVVQVEREVAEELLQRRHVRVEADEDHPVVDVHRRCGEKGLVLARVAGFAAVGVAVEGQPDQSPVVAVGPPVVRTAEVRGVADLGAAHLHSSVQAHVEQGANLPVLVTHDDERVLQDVPHDVVARCGHLGLVRDEHPAAREQPLLLEREDLGVVVDVRRDHAPPDVREHL